MITQLQFLNLRGWTGIQLKGRVDAFNDKRLMEAIEAVAQKKEFGPEFGAHLALDLSQTEFLSLQMMRFLTTLKRQLQAQRGDLVLVQPSHPVRRQIEIFLGQKVFQVYQSFQELELGLHFQPRAEYLLNDTGVESTPVAPVI